MLVKVGSEHWLSLMARKGGKTNMSGFSDSQDCPKCGGTDTLMTYTDHKPHDYVFGECLECGFFYDTEDGQSDLETLNLARVQHNLEPLAELRQQHTPA